MAMLALQPQPNIRLEMKGHRERLKQAVHPGVTQRDAGFTPEERERLACGVLAGITERGERLGNWALAVLAILLALSIGVGMVKDRWAEKHSVQTVEAQ